MRRALVDRLGPFNERLGVGTSIPAAEDADYNFRAYLADAMLEYVPDMTVFHHHGRKSLAGARKLVIDYEIGNGALYARYLFRHPNLAGRSIGISGMPFGSLLAGSTPLGPTSGSPIQTAWPPICGGQRCTSSPASDRKRGPEGSSLASNNDENFFCGK